MQIFPHFFQKFPYLYSFFMKMEWIWPIRGMVGKLGLYILLWRNDIRKSCFQIRISKKCPTLHENRTLGRDTRARTGDLCNVTAAL